jgi:hypothetical protein
MPLFAFYSTFDCKILFLPSLCRKRGRILQFAQTKTMFFVENTQIFVDLNIVARFPLYYNSTRQRTFLSQDHYILRKIINRA